MLKNINPIKFISIFLTILVFGLLVVFPKDMLLASADGIKVWYNNVFPSLFPFIVGVNMLTYMGVSSSLGKILNPVMRPLFNVPGSASFALIMGVLSGYPVGAKVAANLYENGELTTTEVQRVLSFSNNPGPLFVLGTVASSMLNNPILGYIMVLSYMLASLLTGIIFRFYRSFEPVYNPPVSKAKKTDQLSFGAALGNSINDAMSSILQIGGYIILFSVVAKAVDITGLLDLTTNSVTFLFTTIPKDPIPGIVIGFIEMTNGSNILSIADISIYIKTVIIIGILSWGGISIHCQSLSFLNKTNISTSIYFFSKLINSMFSILIAMLLIPLFKIDSTLSTSLPVLNILESTKTDQLTYSLAILSIFFLLALFINLFKSIRNKYKLK